MLKASRYTNHQAGKTKTTKMFKLSNTGVPYCTLQTVNKFLCEYTRRYYFTNYHCISLHILYYIILYYIILYYIILYYIILYYIILYYIISYHVGSKCDIFLITLSVHVFFRYASMVFSCSYFSLFHLFISVFCTFFFIYVAFCSFSHNLSSYVNMSVFQQN